MYNVGDMVMYGAFGICKVTAVEKRDFTGEEQE
jgi:CarD family transcriptional regulator